VIDIADELRRVIPIADSYGRPLHERALAEIERLRTRVAELEDGDPEKNRPHGCDGRLISKRGNAVAIKEASSHDRGE
jgi:hypothetical protein